MTWPAWADVLPTLALLIGMAGSVAGAFWVLMRMFQPVADRAARDAVDTLYERLKANDFKHVEDGIRALGVRFDRMRTEVTGRLDRADNRLRDGLHRLEQADQRIWDGMDGMREDVGARLDRADQRLEEGLGRMREDVGARLDRADQRLEEGLGRMREDFGARFDRADQRLMDGLNRLEQADQRLWDQLEGDREERREMEARLLAAIRETREPE